MVFESFAPDELSRSGICDHQVTGGIPEVHAAAVDRDATAYPDAALFPGALLANTLACVESPDLATRPDLKRVEDASPRAEIHDAVHHRRRRGHHLVHRKRPFRRKPVDGRGANRRLAEVVGVVLEVEPMLRPVGARAVFVRQRERHRGKQQACQGRGHSSFHRVVSLSIVRRWCVAKLCLELVKERFAHQGHRKKTDLVDAIVKVLQRSFLIELPHFLEVLFP